MLRTLALFIACLVSTTCFAQIELKHGAAILLPEGTNIKALGDRWIVQSTGGLEGTYGEVVAVETEATNVRYRVRNKTGQRITFEKIPPNGIFISTPGYVFVECDVVDFDKKIWEWDEIEFIIAEGPDTPDPVDPDPPPDVDPPIDGPGLRVLLVYESSEINQLTKQQQDIFYSPTVREFLSANCIKVDGQPDWRILDKDTKYTDTQSRFAKALARPRTSTPWIVISNGKTGYEGPLPATVNDTIELVERYK